jgi:hypothetical protein
VRFVERKVARTHSTDPQHLLDDLLVDGGVLPQVDGGQVEAKGLHGAA